MLLGIKQLLFLKDFNHTYSPAKIDLYQNPNATLGKGYFEVTGFIGPPIEYVYYGNDDTGATTFYYYPFSSNIERTEVKLLIQDDRTPLWGEDIKPTMMTLQGIIGIESAPSKIQKQFENNPPLLVLAEAPPQLSKVLRWFIPISLAFLFGIYLVIDWTIKAKKQAF